MAHKEQQEFCLMIKNIRPQDFRDRKVLDCGSLDINGNNRYLFDNCSYTGVDLGEGPNVDIVSPIHKVAHFDESYDTIISTECFEHDKHYKESLKNIVRLLRPKGMFIFTCATTGRPEHGTTRTLPGDAPFTNDYYKNITQQDIEEAIDLEKDFSYWQFYTEDATHDLQFWGIKK